MSPLLKISLATGKFKDAHQRGAWKRACIDAELASKIVVKPTKDRNSNNNGNRGATSNYTVTSNSATPSA